MLTERVHDGGTLLWLLSHVFLYCNGHRKCAISRWVVDMACNLSPLTHDQDPSEAEFPHCNTSSNSHIVKEAEAPGSSPSCMMTRGPHQGEPAADFASADFACDSYCAACRWQGGAGSLFMQMQYVNQRRARLIESTGRNEALLALKFEYVVG